MTQFLEGPPPAEWMRKAIELSRRYAVMGGYVNTACRVVFTKEEIAASAASVVAMGAAGGMNCIKPVFPGHPCPYQEDAENNPNSECNCCEGCTNECARDI